MKKIYTIVLLVSASVLMCLATGHYMIGYAAWIYPLLFMIATKDMKDMYALILIASLSAISMQISFLYFAAKSPESIMFYIPAFMGIVYALPFYIQKLAFKRTRRFIATFIFPSLISLLDYSLVYFNPNGTFGVLGYSQHGFLPIAQMASVFGVVGITFIITWIPTVIFWFLFSDSKNKKSPAIITFSVLILMLLFGSLRIAFDYKDDTVMISGIHVYDIRSEEMSMINDLLKTDEQKYIEKTNEFADLLIEKTVIEAKLGSKIVVHSECSPEIHHTQINDYMDNIQSIANEYDIYIVTTPYINYNGIQKDENVLHIVNPNGEIVLTHYKYGGNLFEGTVCGDKIIRYIDTEYGRLSGIICWDKDFPSIVNQVGEKDIDILFIPSADWAQITPTHTIQGNFRGIENGTNIVSQVVNGMSAISNYKGQVLTSMNHYTDDEWIMRGYVPIKGANTIYNVFGKYFVYCVIILATISIYYSLFGKPKNKE